VYGDAGVKEHQGSRKALREEVRRLGANPSKNAPVQVMATHLQTSTTLTGHLGEIRLLEVTGGQMPPCPFSRVELRRILTAPVTTLAPVEREARDLLNKFHDRSASGAQTDKAAIGMRPQYQGTTSAAHASNSARMLPGSDGSTNGVALTKA